MSGIGGGGGGGGEGAPPAGSLWASKGAVSLSTVPSGRGYPGFLVPAGAAVLSLGEERGWVRMLSEGAVGWIPLWHVSVALRRVG